MPPELEEFNIENKKLELPVEQRKFNLYGLKKNYVVPITIVIMECASHNHLEPKDLQLW